MKRAGLVFLSALAAACADSSPDTVAREPAVSTSSLPEVREDQSVEQQTQIVAQWPDSLDPGLLATIEDTLMESGEGLFEVDGYDIGSGTFNVFIYTGDKGVDAAVARIVGLVEDGAVPPEMKLGVAVYPDQSRRDWTFRPAYPAGLTSFELM